MSALIYNEEECDYSDELNDEFEQLRLTEQRIHKATEKANFATSDVYGVASFDNDEYQDITSKHIDWETMGACYDYVGMDQGRSDLDKLLKSMPHHKNGSVYEDNETISTCTSEGTVDSKSSHGTVFISSSNASNQTNKKKTGSKNAKTKLRAIASMIDPKLGQRIKERRGFWSGTFEENTEEGAVEIVIVP
eukprot:scaffold8496_cov66-Cyclotella_meneghiniana.AAC.3